MMKKRVYLCIVSAAVALWSCDCGPRTSRRFPKIEVLDEMGAPRTLVEFGQVQLGFTAIKKVRIRNAGTASLSLSKVDFTQATFGVGTTLPLSIAVNEEYELPITFRPTLADQRQTGTATISCDDPEKPTAQLSLAGIGVTATAVVQPTMLEFGEVYVGEMKELSLSLTNSGSNELPVTSATLTMSVGPAVSADLRPLIKTLQGGETVTVTLRYAPTTPEALSGDLEIVLPAGVGNKTIPIRGLGIQAQPKLCFKPDDSAFEQCTDGAGANLDVRLGSLCDERVYPPDAGLLCELDGGLVPYQRSGRLYVRNEGNTPVSYSLSVTAGQPSRCDGGASIDFHYANAPTSADGGAQAMWMVPTFKLPSSSGAPKPWEAPPLAVTYRARSACRGGDDTDLSTVIWNRQGEPLGTMRRPNSMVMTLTGNSVLSAPVPFPVTFTGNRPLPQEVALVSNTGSGPVRLLKVELWQSGDGGATPTVRCADADAGPCLYFGWTPGALPVLLEGTNVPSARVSKPLGHLSYGILDGGIYYPPTQEQRAFAVVETSDPYTPTVLVPLVGRLQ